MTNSNQKANQYRQERLQAGARPEETRLKALPPYKEASATIGFGSAWNDRIHHQNGQARQRAAELVEPAVVRSGDLRISVMDRCNFRCPYCMPEDKYHKDFEFLKSSERLSFEEILRLAQIFAGLGVRKLRLTGGEPLLRPGIADLVGDLCRVPGIDDVALTTNGILLAQHAAALKAAGLSRVTVSLDALDEDVFLQMSGGRGRPDRCWMALQRR